MNYKSDISKIKNIEKIKMLENLIKKNMYYKCMLLCEIFKKYENNNTRNNLFDKIIKICKTTQNEKEIIENITNLA